MSEHRLIQFKSLADERGQLVALEANREIPFEVKRVYYMTGMVANLPRGFHAHRNLQQLAICLVGRCTFLVNDAREETSYDLSSRDVGLYLGNYVWREMHNFSEDCVLVVLASEHYSEADYIRDYDIFLREVKLRE